MQIRKISYSESRKLTTGVKFESRLISVSAEGEITNFDVPQEAFEKIKEFVKNELQKELAVKK